MLLSFSSVAISLLLAPAVQAGPIVPRQATAPFDCGEVRVDSPNTTYSGFVAADLDTERRYVVTRTENQKRLLTRFENNTLFTLNSNGKNPTFGATFGFYWDTPPDKPNFAASAQNYAYFNSVAASKVGDKPAKIAASINEAGTDPSTGGKRDHESESAIFYLDLTSGELTSQWVNTDGSFVPALFVINTQRRINISGNLTRYFQEWQGAPARIFCSQPA
ncbi:hypothetical protein QBC33DRAFT_550365 [Phialemonium atrogriseum]|uniref:Uncharacterized protein n=1 Tax=Phialemonium atrogriseum TaxID=1093897 RepID=A0AAJ0BRS3_9PEZI|nr:uncharacterized protein QBC33DRAFT_550365 [Phialemonium atrogriseum]KAK1763096.1 hypothetical protein QBC33DRAFT_550365 [Phialemonium atrogriseum]